MSDVKKWLHTVIGSLPDDMKLDEMIEQFRARACDKAAFSEYIERTLKRSEEVREIV